MSTTFLIRRDNGYRERLDISNQSGVPYTFGTLSGKPQIVILTKAAALAKIQRDVNDSTAHVVRLNGKRATILN